jgi:hypothetical protein
MKTINKKTIQILDREGQPITGLKKIEIVDALQPKLIDGQLNPKYYISVDKYWVHETTGETTTIQPTNLSEYTEKPGLEEIGDGIYNIAYDFDDTAVKKIKIVSYPDGENGQEIEEEELSESVLIDYDELQSAYLKIENITGNFLVKKTTYTGETGFKEDEILKNNNFLDGYNSWTAENNVSIRGTSDAKYVSIKKFSKLSQEFYIKNDNQYTLSFYIKNPDGVIEERSIKVELVALSTNTTIFSEVVISDSTLTQHIKDFNIFASDYYRLSFYDASEEVFISNISLKQVSSNVDPNDDGYEMISPGEPGYILPGNPGFPALRLKQGYSYSQPEEYILSKFSIFNNLWKESYNKTDYLKTFINGKNYQVPLYCTESIDIPLPPLLRKEEVSFYLEQNALKRQLVTKEQQELEIQKMFLMSRLDSLNLKLKMNLISFEDYNREVEIILTEGITIAEKKYQPLLKIFKDLITLKAKVVANLNLYDKYYLIMTFPESYENFEVNPIVKYVLEYRIIPEENVVIIDDSDKNKKPIIELIPIGTDSPEPFIPPEKPLGGGTGGTTTGDSTGGGTGGTTTGDGTGGGTGGTANGTTTDLIDDDNNIVTTGGTTNGTISVRGDIKSLIYLYDPSNMYEVIDELSYDFRQKSVIDIAEKWNFSPSPANLISTGRSTGDDGFQFFKSPGSDNGSANFYSPEFTFNNVNNEEEIVIEFLFKQNKINSNSDKTQLIIEMKDSNNNWYSYKTFDFYITKPNILNYFSFTLKDKNLKNSIRLNFKLEFNTPEIYYYYLHSILVRKKKPYENIKKIDFSKKYVFSKERTTFISDNKIIYSKDTSDIRKFEIPIFPNVTYGLRVAAIAANGVMSKWSNEIYYKAEVPTTEQDSFLENITELIDIKYNKDFKISEDMLMNKLTYIENMIKDLQKEKIEKTLDATYDGNNKKWNFKVELTNEEKAYYRFIIIEPFIQRNSSLKINWIFDNNDAKKIIARYIIPDSVNNIFELEWNLNDVQGEINRIEERFNSLWYYGKKGVSLSNEQKFSLNEINDYGVVPYLRFRLLLMNSIEFESYKSFYKNAYDIDIVETNDIVDYPTKQNPGGNLATN